MTSIALVISSLGPGGAERIASALANAWVALGHDVTLVTVGSTADDTYPLSRGVRRVGLDLLRPSRGLLEGALQATRRVVRLRAALLAADPSVVVSFLDRTNVLTLLATAGTGLPVLVCERSDPRLNAIGRAWAPLRRLLYPRAAAVVVQTESVARWAREFCPRVHVIPNFVERPDRVATPEVAVGPKRLVAMGRLVPAKGFDLLIQAFARTSRAYPDWSLTILGEGPERSRLEALVSELGLQARVSLPGRTRDPVPALAAAHAFVLSSRREGYPNALLEAMACGLPAVSFDCPSGPGDIITPGQDGLLVPSGDVGALGEALGRLMGSAIDRARFGRNAREVALRLAPEQILGRWAELLERVEARG